MTSGRTEERGGPFPAPRRRRRTRLLGRGTVEAVVAALAGSLIAATLVGAHGDSTWLHTCHTPDGIARLIAPPDSPTSCNPDEVLDEWVVQGQPTEGPPGARGPAGAAGTRGPAGRDGRPGPAYTFRIARQVGTTPSATARCAAGELALSGGWTVPSGVTVTGGRRSGADAWTVTGAAPGAAVSIWVVCAKPVTP